MCVTQVACTEYVCILAEDETMSLSVTWIQLYWLPFQSTFQQAHCIQLTELVFVAAVVEVIRIAVPLRHTYIVHCSYTAVL